jgi:hypothetical protein
MPATQDSERLAAENSKLKQQVVDNQETAAAAQGGEDTIENLVNEYSKLSAEGAERAALDQEKIQVLLETATDCDRLRSQIPACL